MSFSQISGTGITAAPMITKFMDLLRFVFSKTLLRTFFMLII